MTVYTTTFEMIGEGRAQADRYEQQKRDAAGEQWAFVKEVGGSGYCPSAWNGALQSVLFDGELPEGWRRIGTVKGKTNAVPKASTKAGKGWLAKIAALPCKPLPTSLAADLGYNPASFAMDGFSIYFPTEIRVEHPETRHFLRLPLQAGDGFEPDLQRLKPIAERELMKAVEDHNAEARRLREVEPSA